MAQLSKLDSGSSPPIVDIPRDYNAAYDLIERNLVAGRGSKVAYIDDEQQYTYAELAERVDRAGNALRALGLGMEDRILLCHLDTIDWPAVFLGAIKAGVVPVAVNTMLNSADYEFMLNDSRAKALVVSEALLPLFADVLKDCPHLKHILVSGGDGQGRARLRDALASAATTLAAAPTTADDPCFWLYSSGSTGKPKGTVHVHSSLVHTAELYARQILGMQEDDLIFSTAKLFFAYGLGNSLSFPLALGATALLMADRPTPPKLFERLKAHRPTIFCTVPTLYARLLADPELPQRADVSLRICVSAGEALPAELGRRWSEHFGVDVLDGLGTSEMLHIFLSNVRGDVRYGTSGKAVPGYEIRIVDDAGADVGVGEIGDLLVAGPTAAAGYWNNRERTRSTFLGAWTRTGDKYLRDADGYYTYCGRTDDMFKVSGMFVSPFEIEAALATHPVVLEAAVIGIPDEAELMKAKAFVVLKEGTHASAELAAALQQHIKNQLAPHKHPRWVEFLPDLPKTATGKIQRFMLRALERTQR